VSLREESYDYLPPPIEEPVPVHQPVPVHHSDKSDDSYVPSDTAGKSNVDWDSHDHNDSTVPSNNQPKNPVP